MLKGVLTMCSLYQNLCYKKYSRNSKTVPLRANITKILPLPCPGILIFINCAYVKWGTLVQDVFTYAKLMALLLIICIGILKMVAGEWKITTQTNHRQHMAHVLSFGIFLCRRDEELWESIWRLIHRSWRNLFGSLLCSFLLLRLGYTQLCYRGD